jgi:NADH-quinone oxidoreductase subunit A
VRPARPPEPATCSPPGADLRVNLRDYLPVLVFFGIGLAIGASLLLLGRLGRRKRNAIKELPYESGILATGAVRQRFSIDFYLTAMLFIVFDIELAFFYPLAVVIKSVGLAAVVELVIFVGVLGAALAYVWRKGALEWR